MPVKDYEIKEAFSKNIIKYRGEKGLTQESLAAQLGVSLRHYQRIEKVHIIPNIMLAYRLALVFEVSLDDIFKMESV